MSVAVMVIYALAVAAVAAPAGWLLERALTDLRLPARWVWIAALGLCIGLPLAGFVSGPGEPEPAASLGPLEAIAPMAQADVEVEPSDDGRWGIGPALEPLAGLRAELDRALASGASLLPAGDRANAWIAGVWLTASILVALVLLVSLRRLRRRANAWPDETLFGRLVKLSPGTGPATVGTFRPLVVIPRWARELPRPELELVLRHEGEHVSGRDTVLLAMGLVAVMACPWNPLIWWQVRRLKEAVEVDCDRRVLRSGVAPARYGELLVKVGTRRNLGSLAIPAIAGSIPLLERRLTVMKAVGDRVSFPRIAAAMAGALLLVVIACTTDPPVAADARATEAEVDTEDRGRDVVAIRVDRDGTARVNDRVVPIDLVAEVMAPYAPDAVVSLDVHEAARYGAVAALQDQLRTVGLTRVVFTLVESEDRPASAPDGSAREDNGLPVVLPEATMPDVGEVDLDPRNLLYLDVLRSGIVGARFGGDPRRPQKMTRDELELVWRRGVSLNPNLTAVVRTDPEADYEHMYDVLDALRRADAQRVSLQVAR